MAFAKDESSKYSECIKEFGTMNNAAVHKCASRNLLESQIMWFDFIEFCAICLKQDQKVAQLLHFMTMSKKEKIW